MLALAVACCLLAISFAPADAYDAQPVHRWLTRIAVERLVAAYPGQYDELLEYLDRVVDGAQHEDDLILDGDSDPSTLRVQRHFFRPTDELGLLMSDTRFPSAYEWGVLPNPVNRWDWSDALAAYRRGDLEEAMYALGHLAHLVQDMAVPAHTHLDIHAPPYGDDYERYCTAQTPDEHTSMLPVPPEGAPVPEFASPLEAWRTTAEASFYRNLYPGDLGDSESPAGVIAQMFPSLSWSWYWQRWEIDSPPVGSLGTDFIEEQPGWFYFEDTEHAAAVDVVAFDSADETTPRYGSNDSGAAMMELFARDLIPVAIMNSAGTMKLFLDQAHAPALASFAPGENEAGKITQGCSAAPSAAASALLAVVVLGLLRRRTRCAH